ncbi:MAG: SusE domain-containing protein [Bacteroides sp.]|jgi:hypothetical protein|nr:SusE domain-containing protein [Bacteroides sp.]
MKRIAIILTLIFGVFLFHSCEEEELMTMDLSKTVSPQITSPTTGASLVLTQETAGDVISITWSAANYEADFVADANYILQMDVAGNNFANPRDLIDTDGLAYETTQGAVNSRILGMEFAPNTEVTLEYRVFSYLTRQSEATYAFSDPISITFTTYEAVIPGAKPIYMLGSGTEAGWDNTAALEMYYIEEGVFSLVAHLHEDGDMVKFISVLGQWAPQWGAVPGGTSTEGELILRPTEDDPDPNPIMITDLEIGDYRVTADTANLTYSIVKVTEELYLLGSATEAGWDNTGALAMTKDAPGMFSITTTLTAGEDMFFKFIEVLGQWAPQYGTNVEGTAEGGQLVFRETESVPDPPAIPAPDVTGTYKIEVNLSNLTYTVTAQ